MPGKKFSKEINTPKAERQWETVYAGAKKAGKPPATAIKIANAAVAKAKKS